MDGLSCALRLGSHGYQVTVFDMNPLPGGSVLEMMDPEVCRQDIETSFSVYDEVTFKPGIRVDSTDQLKEYDAVYLALTGGWLEDISISDTQGAFITSAENCEVPATERMACGLNAADHIEFWFQLGDKAEYTRLYGSTEPDERYYGIRYSAGEAEEDTESAEAEAARCYQCNCDECFKVCPVMQREKQFPKRMTAYVIGTIWPNATRRPGVRMLTGCTMCGKCRDMCPENIDMGECFREARKDFYNSGHFAPAYHDYWMQELEFVQSDEAYLLCSGKGCKDSSDCDNRSASAVFFPGCQLGASDPELVIRSYEFLQRTCDDPALLLSCCGVTAEWAGDEKTRTEITDRIRKAWKDLGEPAFITGCSACRTNLARYLPEIKTVSLFRWIADHKDTLTEMSGQNKTAMELSSCDTVIYDPCGADGDDDTKRAARELAELAGLQVVDAGKGKMPACCGFGGHIYPANPDLYDAMIPELPEGTGLIVYCANCRDSFISKGYETSHILEKIFSIEKTGYNAADPTERRMNRRKLRAYYTGDEIVGMDRRYRLEIPEDARKKLERLLLLEEQIYVTLEQAEDTKEKFLDRETGLYYACRRFRNLTVWISYRELSGEGFVLEDVYTHRVEVKE